MAEFDIGQQCAEKTCKQLDFLPITCPACQLIFCRLHCQPSSHACAHQDDHQIATPSEIPPSDSVQSRCDLADCHRHDLLAVECEHCRRRFCLKHRHAVDHSCPWAVAVKTEKTPRVTVPAMHGTKTSTDKSEAPAKTARKGGGSKSAQTAAKVALMKLKMHATGDKSVPQMDRVFFNAIPPISSSLKSCGVFFSSRWAVGRVVDYLAKHWSLPHSMTSSQRLQLYQHSSAEHLDMSTPLKDLSSTLMSGSTVVLEYGEGKDALSSPEKYSL